MKWMIGLLLASLFQCGSFSKKEQPMNTYQYQIIIQTQPGVDISVEDNSFQGHSKTQKLNKALSRYTFEVAPIASKLAEINDYKQFRLLTNDNPDEIVEQLLLFSSFIDGAYRKNFAEDTGKGGE